MISRLCGVLVSAEPTEALVDVHGVGYDVISPLSTYDRLPRPGEPVTLLTHFHVREDAQQLFGFATVTERQLFRLLMTVNGVGPKLALSAVSSLPVETFCAAVAGGDVKTLSGISGIGKRTAERLVLELKEKITDISPAAALGAGAPGSGAAPAGGLGGEAKDAIAGLQTLGFKADQAQKAVARLCSELPAKEHTAANLIRRALQLLNG